MKKVSILLLLTVVLTAFSFAQVSVVGGFEAANLTGGNDGDMDPALWTEFYGAASQELGPGTIGAELGLGTKLHLSDKFAPYDDAGDIYLKGSYTLPAGPGALSFGLSTWHKFDDLHFDLGYSGIAAGPVTLGFGITYALKTTGFNDDGESAIFGDGPKDSAAQDVFTGKLTASFDFGLGLTYKLKYGIGDENEVVNIVYLDLNYQVIDPLLVGLEVDDTGDEFKGFTAKLYGNYSITEKTTAGIFFKIQNINNDAEGHKDIELSPGLTITHVF
jgi:hypothetical protein